MRMLITSRYAVRARHTPSLDRSDTVFTACARVDR